MSLQLAAQHLASRGRGPDTQLIHMAPQEVAGLHALAKAHGGSLTTNPDTGLPEAGFLSKLLPTLIGFGLAPFTGGLSAALMVGAGYTAATGSLKKGLMAGLGAFGGASLGAGLGAAGAAGTAAAETGLTAAGGVMGTNPMLASPMTFGAETLGAAAPTAGLEAVAGQGANAAANLTGIPGFTGSTVGLTPPPGVMPAAMAPPVTTAPPVAAAPAPVPTTPVALPTATPAPTPIMDKYSQMGRGIESLTTPEGRSAFMGSVGGGSGLLKSGMMAASPIMFQEPEPFKKPKEEKPYEYSYSSGYNPTPDEGYTGAETGERMHFDHRFTRKAAGGGLMDIQPIEAMSQQNQSQMRPAYAQGGVSDMAVNPYTGAENFDEGGDTTAKPAKDPYNTMTGQSAAMYDYLMGQGQRPAAAPRAPAPAMAVPQGSGFFGTAPGQVAPLPGGTAFLGQPPAGAAPSGLSPITTPEDSSPFKRLLGGLSGGRSDEPLTMSYTFDPMTGGFQKLAPTEANYEAPVTNTQMDYGSYTGGGYAQGGIASLAEGGQSHLGDYSDGGRLLRGPGDGVSDSIPASIGDKRPARLADGEFVVPARIVSELGNGSTEAGARKLYAMMDRVQKARAKTTGKDRVATNTKAERLLPV